ncbi:hypothetical protein PROFUN_09912, partial [Planoprotostelium fungivorum]
MVICDFGQMWRLVRQRRVDEERISDPAESSYWYTNIRPDRLGLDRVFKMRRTKTPRNGRIVVVDVLSDRPPCLEMADTQHAQEPKNGTSSKKPAPTVNPVAAALMKEFPVTLQATRAKGRHAVAAKALDEGVMVNHEFATSWIVRSPFLRDICHHCNDEIGGGRLQGCERCKWAFYCSTECKAAANDRHQLECSVLPHMIRTATEADCDLDLLRLLFALITSKKREKEGQKEEEKEKGTPFEIVDELISHKESFKKEWLHAVKKGIETLRSHMSQELLSVVDNEQMLELACKINSNSHGFGDVRGRNRDVSLGMAPLTATFFNHSCAPNCIYQGSKGGSLQVRTIRKVNAGEELVVHYVDIFAPRYERRQKLMETKHFWCKCKRCIVPFDQSPDRFLNAYKCRKCKKGHITFDPISKPEDLKNGRSDEEYKCDTCKEEIEPESINEESAKIGQ